LAASHDPIPSDRPDKGRLYRSSARLSLTGSAATAVPHGYLVLPRCGGCKRSAAVLAFVTISRDGGAALHRHAGGNLSSDSFVVLARMGIDMTWFSKPTCVCPIFFFSLDLVGALFAYYQVLS
jgi:hypothetical protein